MAIRFRSAKQYKTGKIDYGPFKRYVPKWQWYILFLIIASPLIYFLIKLFLDYYFVKAVGYVAFDTMVIRAPENGYVSTVYVKTGEHIVANQKLLQFASPSIDKNLEYLKRELKLLSGLKKQSVNQQSAELLHMQQEAKKNIEELTKFYQEIRQLKARGFVTIKDVDQAWRNLHDAKMELSDAQRKLKETNQANFYNKENYFSERIRTVIREIAVLEQLRIRFSIQAEKKLTVIEVNTHPGEYVKAGQVLMTLATEENFHIKAFLSPKHLDAAKQHAKVSILFPDKERIAGVISNKPAFAESAPNSSPILSEKDKKIVLIIKSTQSVPKKYQIYGVPVEVFL